ncbi:MAG: manganese efflux pump [Clostridia bacterium]|nr:manganese efflux pump [Clostridia bacterium]
MDLDFQFFFRSILLGFGLAMDAFSVSVANGLNEPKMKPLKMCGTAGIFAFFQFLMPMIGWLCVCLIASLFGFFEKLIPWIALVLLCFIGIKMIIDAVKSSEQEEKETKRVGLLALLVQGIATSIDALSVGFTISEYNVWESLLACGIIGVLTFGICLGGIFIGKKVGGKLAGKAGIFGGAILIIIGLEIFITSWF